MPQKLKNLKPLFNFLSEKKKLKNYLPYIYKVEFTLIEKNNEKVEVSKKSFLKKKNTYVVHTWPKIHKKIQHH